MHLCGRRRSSGTLDASHQQPCSEPAAGSIHAFVVQSVSPEPERACRNCTHGAVPAVLRWRQVMSGFPVVAVLMCIEDHAQLVLTIDGFIDQLHKLLRDRRAASMAVLCLCRVAACFIRRMAARSDAGGWQGMCGMGEWWC